MRGIDGRIAHEFSIVVTAGEIRESVLEVPIGDESGSVGVDGLIVPSSDVIATESRAPDRDLVDPSLEVLCIQSRTDSVVGICHIDARYRARGAKDGAVVVPTRLRAIVGDGEVMPAVAVRARVVREDAARGKVFIVVIAPEVVPDSSGSTHSETVGLVACLFSPEGDLTPSAATSRARRIDPGSDRKRAVSGWDAGPRKRHPISISIQLKRRPGRESGEGRKGREKNGGAILQAAFFHWSKWSVDSGFWTPIVHNRKRTEFVPQMQALPLLGATRLILILAVITHVVTSLEVVAQLEGERFANGREGSGFHRIPGEQSGLSVRYDIRIDGNRKHLYTSGLACGGLASGDVDGDGRPDLFFCGTSGASRLFLNRGNFRFEESGQNLFSKFAGDWASGASLVDIENDGDLDLYICNYDAPNRLFLNDGGAFKTDEAKAAGLAVVDAFIAPYFADYDRDGDLDVFLLTNRYYSPTGFPEKVPNTLSREQARFFQLIEPKPGTRDINIVPRKDRLFRNEGGTFVEVSDDAGFRSVGHGLSAAWWDYNGDGWLDLYVCNDFDDPDLLYRNNRDGTFTDVVAEVMPHISWFSMGSDVADINNDGFLDFLAADMSATTHYKDKTTMGAMGARSWVMETAPRQYMRNALYVNTGLPHFLEAAYLAGLAETDWTWAVKFADYDCDGRVDVFFTNGMTRNFNNSDIPFQKKYFIGRSEWEHYEKTAPRPERNLAYRNVADFEFEDRSESWGLDYEGMSFATATADFDLDGDLDLAVVNMDEEVHLYRNDLSDENRIAFRLKGAKSNRDGIGAQVTIQTASGIQTRIVNPMTGFKSCNESGAWFGLGELTEIEGVTIDWPGGGRQIIEEGLAAGRRYTIRESSGAEDTASSKEPLFAASDLLPEARHKEQPFNDFSLQPLLPNKLSQLGPGTAWGDVDGDGDDDFFVGGALGRMGEMHFNLGGGRFRKSETWTFSDDLACEDMGALFFDADSDGDEDLYVVSGGVEAPPGHEIYRDRLYLNNGRGYFTKARGHLPDLRDSGSCVVAGDLDRDGDLDLFVGGRVVPGQYPVAPKSRLLLNEGGKFTDISEQVRSDPEKAGFSDTGMITGAVWSDHDADGWIDLLLAQEWGPIKVFRNQKGVLSDRTGEAGVGDRSGWWNGITSGDLDNDGDMDYVVTNFGLNTKYHSPAVIHYGDLDGSGKMRIAEAEYENGTCFPIRGKSCSTRAMPGLKQRFKTFEKFALASLEEIYGRRRLQETLRLEVTNFESGVLLNDGRGMFAFRPFPRLAQIAPSFGAVVSEFTGDGILDVVLAQNFFSPQVETGRMDGGLGLLLKGKGDGSFEALMPKASGIDVPGDAASLTTVDLDGDRCLDLVFGMNDAPVVVRRGSAKGKTIRLKGKPGNLYAVGAMVTVHDKGGARVATMEVVAGGGYLSQSPSSVTLDADLEPTKARVRWPNGATSEHALEAGRVESIITQKP